MRWTLPILALLVASGAEAQTSHVAMSSDGVPIHFEIHGNEHPGPTLILVPGWSNDRSVWEPHVGALADEHPVVALDLAGFGRSGTGRSNWSMDAYGDDVVAVVEALDLGNAVLVGFSMGGVAALEAALEIPEHLAGVVLVDVLQDPETRLSRDDVAGLVETFRAGWRDRDWVRETGFSPAAQDSLIDRYLSSLPPDPPPPWWESLENVFRWMGNRARPTLERLEVPLAAINSDRVATNVAAYRSYAPDFDLRVIPDVGHLGVLWEKPELFRSHLRSVVREMEGRVAADAEAEIRETIARYLSLLERSDIEAAGTFWTDDARLLAPGAELDRAGVVAAMEAATEVGTVEILDRTTLDLFVHGDAAYEIARAEEVFRGPGGAPADTVRNNLFVRWEEGPDGRWRFDRVVIGPRDTPLPDTATGAAPGDDREAIEEIRRRHVEAVTSGDVDALLADMADDVVYMGPGLPPIQDREALESILRPFYAQNVVDLEMTAEQTVLSDDWALERGRGMNTVRPRAGGESISSTFSYVYVFHREPDGEWKLKWDIYNDDGAGGSSSGPPGREDH